MEYSPPPLFKQGASARAKVVFFALVSLTLLVADAHLQALTVVRQVVGTALYPLQVAALMPRDAAYAVAGYFSSLSALEDENRQLKKQQTANARTLQQAQQLAAENAQLRKLLGASEQMPAKALMGEILYDARDAFTRKIVLNRGSQHGVAPGQPVIDDVGVVGQVTRVFPFTSEITLLTDKDQAIPVQVVRNGLRSVAYGHGQSGALDLRFMATNADIQKGDVLVTSGIDGVYPPGLAVGKVAQVETKSSDVFARIVCNPTAGIDRNRQLLILLVDTMPPPRPAAEIAIDKKLARKADAGAAKDAPPHAATVPAATDKAPANATQAAAAPPDATAKPVAKEAPQAAPDAAPAPALPPPALPKAVPQAVSLAPKATPQAASPAPQAAPKATPPTVQPPAVPKAAVPQPAVPQPAVPQSAVPKAAPQAKLPPALPQAAPAATPAKVPE